MHSAVVFDGALQMAIDELLLREVSGVLLRDYQWAEPTTSIGFFGISSDIVTTRNNEVPSSLVRRPTGGGLVEHGHGQDYTYSVVISAAQSRQLHLAPRASYGAIHRILVQILREFGVAATIADGAQGGDGGQACFANPVADDVLLEGEKIAGAGQKRSRGAILHQGSVQPVDLPDEFGAALASGLASRVDRVEIDSALLSEAEALAEEKYRSEVWTRRR
jgi:lipoate-protein ligase A